MEHPQPEQIDVLVVDDNESMRGTVRFLLEKEGYRVFEAPDGISALERLRTSPLPLVVVLDWMMPGLDGVQVLAALAADAAMIRPHGYILLTAAERTVHPYLRDRIPPELPVTIIGKPFDIPAFLALVNVKADAVRAGWPATENVNG